MVFVCETSDEQGRPRDVLREVGPEFNCVSFCVLDLCSIKSQVSSCEETIPVDPWTKDPFSTVAILEIALVLVLCFTKRVSTGRGVEVWISFPSFDPLDPPQKGSVLSGSPV